MKVRPRAEALDAVRSGGHGRRRGAAYRSGRVGDGEGVRAVRSPEQVERTAHRDRLAGGERLRGEEARAVIVRVAGDATCVRPGARADHLDRAERRWPNPAEGDLRPGTGKVRTRAREHAHLPGG